MYKSRNVKNSNEINIFVIRNFVHNPLTKSQERSANPPKHRFENFVNPLAALKFQTSNDY